MLTDRQRVELAVPARLMFRVMTGGAFEVVGPNGETLDEPTPEAVDLIERLRACCVEPMADLAPDHAAKIKRRVDRLAHRISGHWTGETAVKWALAVAYLVKDLTDSGALVLVDGSPFDRAFADYMTFVEHGLEVEAIDQAAQKQARRLLRDLQAEGLFQ